MMVLKLANLFIESDILRDYFFSKEDEKHLYLFYVTKYPKKIHISVCGSSFLFVVYEHGQKKHNQIF